MSLVLLGVGLVLVRVVMVMGIWVVVAAVLVAVDLLLVVVVGRGEEEGGGTRATSITAAAAGTRGGMVGVGTATSRLSWTCLLVSPWVRTGLRTRLIFRLARRRILRMRVR
jgi:hypothetical protein